MLRSRVAGGEMPKFLIAGSYTSGILVDGRLQRKPCMDGMLGNAPVNPQ